MSLMKHFGEQSERHGGQLFWSQAMGGVPFSGPHAPTLTQEEIDTKVGVHLDFRSLHFDLSDPAQKQHYDWVMDRIVNGMFALHFIQRHIDWTTHKTYAYVEWGQKYARLNEPVGGNGHVVTVNTHNSNGQTSSSAHQQPSHLAGQQHPSVGLS